MHLSIPPSLHPYKHTNLQTYRHTNLQTYRHKTIQTYKHTNIQTYIQTYMQTYRHTDRHACIHTYMLHVHIISGLQQNLPGFLLLKALSGNLYQPIVKLLPRLVVFTDQGCQGLLPHGFGLFESWPVWACQGGDGRQFAAIDPNLKKSDNHSDCSQSQYQLLPTWGADQSKYKGLSCTCCTPLT